MEISEKITFLRKRRGWSQELLATKLEVSRQAVYKWEAGISLPEIDKLKKISKLFDVTFNELLDDEIDITVPSVSVEAPAITPVEVTMDEVAESESEAPIEEVTEDLEPSTEGYIKNNEENAEPLGTNKGRSKKLLAIFIVCISVAVVALGALTAFLIGYLVEDDDIGTSSTQESVENSDTSSSKTEDSVNQGETFSSSNETEGSGEDTGVSSTVSPGEGGTVDTEKTEFTVKLDTNGGTPVADLICQKGDRISIGIDTKRDGYIISAWINMNTWQVWDFQNDLVEEDMTLLAVWREIQPVTVTFYMTDENSESKTVVGNEVDPIRLAGAFYQTGKKHQAGWSTTPYGEMEYPLDGYASFTEDTSLYGVWAVEIEFIKNDATSLEHTVTSYVGKSYELESVFSLEGVRLLGYSTTRTGNVEYEVGDVIEVLEEPMVLYCIWEKDSFVYADNGTGYTVTWYTGGNGTVEVPSFYKGRRVTKIADGAFYGIESVEKLVLPDYLTAIGEKALNGCLWLTHIEIPTNLSDIDVKAFNSCSALLNFSVASDNNHFSAVDGILYNKEKTRLLKYPVGRDESKVYVPNGTHIVGKFAFYRCCSVEEVILPDGVGLVDISAFEGCANMSSIDLGNNVNYVEGRAFYECVNLKSIVFEHDLNTIAKEAFYLCRSLETVEIQGDVDLIVYHAFSECLSLSKFTIGGRAITVQANVFDNCPMFNGIEYLSKS